jgi:hypothetical protein
LSLKVPNNFRETVGSTLLASNDQERSSELVPGLVVDLVAKTGSINNGEGDARSFLVEIELCRPGQSSFILPRVGVLLIRTDGHGLDLDAFLDMGAVRIVGVLVADDRLSTEGVDKGGPA